MPPDPRLVPGVRRIAVLRASALGDFVFALPAFDALSAAYPDAEIVLLGRAWVAALLRDRPMAIDRLVVVPDDSPPRLVPGPPAAVDVAIQLHGGGRTSNPVVAALGARVTAGARTADAAPLDRTIPYVYYQHEVFRALEVVGLVGATSTSFVPTLPVTDGDRRAAAEALPEAEPNRGPLAVLHPGASDPRRRWPASSFARLADRLAEEGVQVVVTGVASERHVVDEVLAGMRHRAIAAVDRLSLPALVGLLAGAAVVVSNDTGPLHLARAVGTPTVGIYWCGNVINAGPPFRARDRIAISWRLDCPTCGTNCITGTCGHRASFVAAVTVDDVASDALDLLSAAVSERRPEALQPAGTAPRPEG